VVRLIVSLLCLCLASGAVSARSSNTPPRPKLAVASNVTAGDGVLQLFQAYRPWNPLKETVAVGGETLMRRGRGCLLLVSRTAGTLSVVDTNPWKLRRTFDLGPGSEPVDVVPVDETRVLISRAGATHLLLLNLRTGGSREVVDLSDLADADGVPDLGTMARFGGRLFIQLRRIDQESGNPTTPCLAVVDLRTGALVDADPSTPGTQGIKLKGTAPRFKMQIFPNLGLLYVSSTGGFFDAGGLEVVNLRTLRSLGLVVREDSGNVGADLGAFKMITPRRGYLTYSTDLLLSSHLHEVRLVNDGFELGPQLHVSLDYFVPEIAYERGKDLIYVPDGTFGQMGVNVFRGEDGTRLTESPLPTDGMPTDLILFR